MKRVFGIALVLTVGLSAGLWIKVRQNQAAQRAPSGGNGVVEGQEVSVSARMPGRITAVKVQEGDRVTAGQLLVQLDCREPQAALAAARAQLKGAQLKVEATRSQAKAARGAARAAGAAVQAAGAQSRALKASRDATSRHEKRVRQLRQVGGVTEADLDRVSTKVVGLDQQVRALQAKQAAARGQAAAAKANAAAASTGVRAVSAAVPAAQAMVQRAQVAVAECSLHAPISGTVLTRAREPGEVVLPGSRVLTVVRLDPVTTVFYLPNRELAAARAGRKVSVVADAYPDQRFSGSIRSVAAEAEFTPRTVQTREDRDRLVYRVSVTIPNKQGKLRPGMPVVVTIDGTGR